MNILRALPIIVTVPFAIPSVAAPLPEREVHIDTEVMKNLSSADQVRAMFIHDRLQAILAMDRSSLDRQDRRALRSEFKELRAEATELNERAGGTVIYLSTAGIIIIILLLIILL